MNPALEALRAKGAMTSATVELTARCPLQCRHCYLGGKSGEELSTERHLRLQDELADLGVIFLLYTGGEVFLRKDLVTLVEAAVRKGFAPILKTSAYPATRDDWLGLIGAGLRYVHISFYDSKPETHDAITRCPGSFQKALDAALFLQEKGVSVKAVFTPMRGGQPDPQVLRAGLADLGLTLIQANLLEDICEDGHCLDDLRLTPEQEAAQLAFFARTGKGFMDRVPPEGALCSAGRSNVFILANGEVLPCHRIQKVIGDLKTQTMQEIWRNSPLVAELRAIRRRDLLRCNGCPDQAYCILCIGKAQAATGSFLIPSEAICKQARAWHRLAKKAAQGDKNGDDS